MPQYYNEVRTHRSLDKDAPLSRPVQLTGTIMSHAPLDGLHHHYVQFKFLVHTGVALLRAGRVLDKLKGENEDQRHGVEMVKKALSWPARQIAINANEDGSVVVGKIQDNDTYAFGFDAQTGKFENLVSHGIIDRPRWSARRRRMRPRLPACSSLPRRWWPRCRRSNRRRPPCPAVAWVAWITERRSESGSSRADRVIDQCPVGAKTGNAGADAGGVVFLAVLKFPATGRARSHRQERLLT